MSDKTSAWLFNRIFTLIHDHVPEPARTRVSREMWNLAREYDFGDYQMHCDPILIGLGLAKLVDYGDGTDMVVYGPVENK